MKRYWIILLLLLAGGHAFPFSIGDRVQVVNGPWSVRATASTSGTWLGQHNTGVTGTIIGGPTTATGYTWYNVNFDSSTIDGWMAQDGLVAIAASSPDLIVSSITATPTSGNPGASISVSVTVKNNGTGSAASSTTRIRLASSTTITTSDPLLDTFTASALSSGQSATYTRTVTVPSGQSASSYYMGATANADSGVAESNGNNNQNTTPFAVTAVQQLPDLVISSVSATPTSGNPGASISVSVTVRNNGPGSAGSSTTRIRLASSTTISTSDPLLDTFTASALSAGQSATYTRTVTIPSGQTADSYYMGATANADSGVSESNGGNNQNTTPFTVSTPTALAPSISSVSPNPITYDAGNAYQTLTIYGANFVNKPTVYVTWAAGGGGGKTLTDSQVTFVNSSQLTMSIHLGMEADSWTVKVTNPDGKPSSAVGFQVVAPASGARPDPSIAPSIRFSLPLSADSPSHYYFDRNASAGAVLAWNGVTTDDVPGGAYDGHRGTDFSGLARNTPVYAAAAGILMEKVDGLPDGSLSEKENPNGNYVRINHGNDSTGTPIISVYLHLNAGSVTSKAIGSQINAGEQIGGIGTSGLSSGLHLHFETQRGTPPNRVAFDPYAASGESSWWVSAAPAPSISSVSPNPITADAGNAYQTLTINGANFVDKPRITLTWTDQPAYALPAERVTFISANQLTILIRLGQAADTWTVKVTNPNDQTSPPYPFQVNAPSGTGNTVLRSAVINTAKSYAEYQWVCSSANANPGYNDFQAGVTYTGVAYNWGGFDAVSSFQTKMSTGVKAGDSLKCVDGIADTTWGGVDCSGFISRCWKTASKYSTTTIPTICTQILWTELKPGDVLNSSKSTPNGIGHVRLFDKYDTGNSDLIWVYEATTPPSVSPGKVVYRSVSVSEMKSKGYLPQRYNLITDDNQSTYTLSYNANGATSGSVPGSQTKTHDVTLTLAGNSGSLAKTGYTFAGWNTAANGLGTDYAAGGSYTANVSVTLYAKWTALPTYTVSYNANGATSGSAPGSQTKTHDVTLTLAGNSGSLAKTGYSFAGWNTAANGSGTDYAAGGSYTANASATLYAKWTALPTYTVSYNANGATSGSVPGSQTKTHDVTLTLAGNSGSLAKTGYTFAGWNTAANGSGTDYAAGGSYTANASVMLYAKWTAVPTYAVTYNANGATSGTAPASQTKTNGIALTLQVNSGTLAKTGFTFAGWNTTANGSGTDYATGAGYTVNAAVTLYAKWTPITYTVAYNGNGNTGGSTASSSHTYDVSNTLTVNGFNRTGYTFAGWATLAGGAVFYSDGQSVLNLAATQGATVTLYAKWTANSYTITFDAQSGTTPTPTSKIVTNGLTYGTLATTTRSGYTFAGWWTATGGGGVQITSGTTVSLAGAQTLYAKWTVTQYTLSVIGGSGSATTYTNQQRVTITASNAPSGQMFNQWTGMVQHVTSVTSSTTTVTMPASNISVTATYKAAAVLTVVSPYGSPVPAVGIYTNAKGSGLTNSVNSPVLAGTTTQYVCTGWTMTGNSPLSGTATSFTMTLTNNATLTWRWSTNYLLTVIVTNGTANISSGWKPAGTNLIITADPNPGYRMGHWTVNGTERNKGQLTLALTNTAPMAVEVIFDKNIAMPWLNLLLE